MQKSFKRISRKYDSRYQEDWNSSIMPMIFILCGLVFGFARGDLGTPRFSPPEVKEVPELVIPEADIKAAFSYAEDQLQARIKSENKYIETGNTIAPGTLSTDLRTIGLTKPKAIQLDWNQELFEDATRWLSKKYSLKPEEALLRLQKVELPSDDAAVQQCKNLKKTSPCNDKDKYRTADGSCNNLFNPTWGQALTCANRIMTADYADGISSPKLAVDGGELPAPRFVSRTVERDLNVPSRLVTQMFMGFAHFIAHDVSLVVSPLAGDSGAYLSCCPDKPFSGELPSICYPFALPQDDPDFSKWNRTCISLVRYAACSERCKVGDPRRVVNQHTAFIDGSAVYGVTDTEMMDLRSKKGGALRHQYHGSDELPPPSEHPDLDQCTKSMPNKRPCFQIGDYRYIQVPGLTSIHITLFREHNRIAKILSSDNPELTDEEVFQETRRILAAEAQMVTYNEMLPVTLGPDFMDFFQLNVLSDGFSTYDPQVDPRIFTEHGTASARFGHTLAESYYKYLNKNGKEEKSITLKENNFRVPYLFHRNIDSFTRGLYWQGIQAFDNNFIRQMTNGDFSAYGTTDGPDHVALNIQRGREVGLPSYVGVVKFCYNITINSFDDLKMTMSLESVSRFQKAYSNVNDIDLYIGGFSETPNKDSILGPAFACLFGQQYRNLKFGDRFYFEHGNQAGSFTEGQLKELRKLTYASIVCKNSKVGKITPKVFRLLDAKNAMIDCADIPSLDFKNWFKK